MEVLMLTKILTLPVAGPIGMSMWLLRTIAERAEAELYDEGRIRKELASLEMRYDLAEITEEEYQAAEEELMERLRESHRRAEAASQ
jgi:hypothetical protein